jgi:transcriptional regulator with XRE-family HTH domain
MRNDLLPEIENDREVQMLYEEEGLVLDVTESVCELLQKQNVKRKELAQRLGVDKSYITQLLDGNSNMTLKTISDVLFCLDSRARIKVEPLKEQLWDFTDTIESSEHYYGPDIRGIIPNKCYDSQSRLVA